MEVDRIAGMGGVGQEANPAWQRAARRRRKFREEVEEPETELENPEEAGADQSDSGRPFGDAAEPGAADDGEAGGFFSVVA